jgi:hypothetical protein
MNARHVIAASLAGGLVSAVLVNTPFVSLINLLVCAGFWIGPILAVGLYRRLSGAPTMGQAVVLGLVAGLWHGVFGLVLSALGLAGAGSLLNELRPIVPSADLTDLETTLTGVGGLLFNLGGVAIDVVFGLVGGLIGGAIFGARRTAV